MIGIATSKYINPGEYYIGNHTLRSGVTVRNTEVGAIIIKQTRRLFT